MDDEWVARNMRVLIASLEAKLAAAEAKSKQRREVLREREFEAFDQTTQTYYCSDCRIDKPNRKHGSYVSPPAQHRPDCAWKRAMEDA